MSINFDYVDKFRKYANAHREELEMTIQQVNRLVDMMEKWQNNPSIDPYEQVFGTGQHPREKAKKMLEGFETYMKEHFPNVEIPEWILYSKGNQYVDNVLERRLAIVRFLQGSRENSKHTVNEIADYFFVSTGNTIRDDLKALRNGITVHGLKLKVEANKERNKYYYSSSVHPVMLLLNATQVYVLLKALEGTKENRKTSVTIKNMIVNQLTPYAKERVGYSGYTANKTDENSRRYSTEEESCDNRDYQEKLAIVKGMKTSKERETEQ